MKSQKPNKYEVTHNGVKIIRKAGSDYKYLYVVDVADEDGRTYHTFSNQELTDVTVLTKVSPFYSIHEFLPKEEQGRGWKISSNQRADAKTKRLKFVEEKVTVTRYELTANI